MRDANLLFDPHDDATWIVHTKTGEPFFTPDEAKEANSIMEQLIDHLGDRVDEILYPIFMEALGRNPYPEDDNDSWKHK
ncbi:hypothetical protein D3C78_1799950 [compost metagenome]